MRSPSSKRPGGSDPGPHPEALRSPRSLWKRLAWFAALWIGSVAVIGAVAFILRLWIA